MLKTFAAVITAAVIAGVFTLASAGNAEVDAGPIAKPITKPAVSIAAPLTEATNCVAQPWPYLTNCTGTPVGIRLVTTDRKAK